MTYKQKQILIRIKYSTFLRLKKYFPADRGESAASYFERLSKYLRDLANL